MLTSLNLQASPGADRFSLRLRWLRVSGVVEEEEEGGGAEPSQAVGCHVCSPCASTQSCRFLKEVTGRRGRYMCPCTSCVLPSAAACLRGWSVFTGGFFFFFFNRSEVLHRGKKSSREEGTSPVLTGRATITLTTPVLLCSLSRSHRS